MTQKFYLHSIFPSGTVPSVASSISAAPPVQIVVGFVNRSMTGTIGVGPQTGVTGNTQATTTTNTILLARWVSEPIAAQTILASTAITFGIAIEESSLNSNFIPSVVLAVWRPSTTSVVGNRFYDGAIPLTFGEPTSAAVEQWFSSLGPSGPASNIVTADGDVIVFEFWRSSTVQGMATAYTNSVYFDGTTDASATTPASYVNFGNDVAMYTGRPSPLSVYPQILPQ